MKGKGILLAGGAGALWALSGISGQSLFQDYHFSAAWLVTARLLISGILLLTCGYLLDKRAVMAPWKNKKDLRKLIIFSIVGMFVVQFTFFKTIEVSSASLATIIQYTGPFFVVIYEVLRKIMAPNRLTFLLMLTTLVGVFLVASKGDISQLNSSLEALLWGVGSAVAVAFYSIYPRQLLVNYGSLVIVGWAMLIGGLVANLIQPIWHIDGQVTAGACLQLIMVIVFGTAIAYWMYLSSLQFISSGLASILTALEPLLATIFSIFLFSQTVTVFDGIGMVIVIGSILVLQRRL